LVRATRLTAIATANRLIRETALGEKLLLANAENKLSAAIFTTQDFVFQGSSLRGL
jgi:hypothetical protein